MTKLPFPIGARVVCVDHAALRGEVTGYSDDGSTVYFTPDPIPGTDMPYGYRASAVVTRLRAESKRGAADARR